VKLVAVMINTGPRSAKGQPVFSKRGQVVGVAVDILFGGISHVLPIWVVQDEI